MNIVARPVNPRDVESQQPENRELVNGHLCGRRCFRKICCVKGQTAKIRRKKIGIWTAITWLAASSLATAITPHNRGRGYVALSTFGGIPLVSVVLFGIGALMRRCLKNLCSEDNRSDPADPCIKRCYTKICCVRNQPKYIYCTKITSWITGIWLTSASLATALTPNEGIGKDGDVTYRHRVALYAYVVIPGALVVLSVLGFLVKEQCKPLCSNENQ